LSLPDQGFENALEGFGENGAQEPIGHLSHGLFPTVAVELFGAGVPQGDAGVHVPDHHIGHVEQAELLLQFLGTAGHQPFQFLLAPGQHRLGLFEGGDLGERQDHAGNGAGGIPGGMRPLEKPAVLRGPHLAFHDVAAKDPGTVLQETAGLDAGLDLIGRSSQIRGHEMEQIQGGLGIAKHPQLSVQNEDGQLDGAEQIFHEGPGRGQFVDLGLQLGVDRGEFLVEGLEFLPGGVHLLVGGLELLIHAEEFLVGGLELLV